jgi:hypothetical protein
LAPPLIAVGSFDVGIISGWPRMVSGRQGMTGADVREYYSTGYRLSFR